MGQAYRPDWRTDQRAYGMRVEPAPQVGEERLISGSAEWALMMFELAAA